MIWDAFITCAVTGVGDSSGRNPHVPITPAQIAAAAIEAAQAGAAIAHIHVRDPATGRGSRDGRLYAEVVARIREAGSDVVINLTAGMGGDLMLGGAEQPLPLGPGTDLAGAEERLAHVAELLPEICTLDCGSMNFAAGDYVMTNTPATLRAMARRVQALGVRPEIEVFDTGHLVLARQLIREGLIEDPVMIQLCMGIPYGAPDDPQTLLAMVAGLPPGAVFSAFSIGRMQLPYVAMALLAGGNIRVGLEDNIWLTRGVPATNGQLVERAAAIMAAMGVRLLGPAEVRAKLRLRGGRGMIRHCAVIGGGVIGGGWAARFLLAGLDVTVFDPHPEAERRLREMLVLAGQAQRALLAAPLPSPGVLRFAGSVRQAVAAADLVQESAPEEEALKRRLLAEIDAAVPAAALICSSTSGLLPTQLAAGMAHPGRFLVAHPFNPVYLLPLVELCGGAATDPAAIERARVFYERLGMRPLLVRHEIDGFIADRLLEALWREALWLVHDGIATVAEVDDAVRFGAGLRWAFMGTFLTYRLAGGEAGMRHFMEQFGPALKLPWTKLVEVPELTDAFLDTLAEQSDAQAAGRSLRALERMRDDSLIGILQALRRQDVGAGAVVAAHEARLREAASGADAALLRLHAGSVPAEWIDYNGHMTESRYLQAFGETTDALLRMLGVDAAMLAAGRSFFTVETHLMHLGELRLGDAFAVTTQVLATDDKRLHLLHRLQREDAAEPAATAEQMLLHVDTARHRACPAAPDVQAAMQRLAAAHRGLAWPPQVGRQVGARAPVA